MPRLKPINKTQSVLDHMKSYGSISRSVALANFKVWDLTDCVKRIKRRKDMKGYRVFALSDTHPNTIYKLKKS